MAGLCIKRLRLVPCLRLAKVEEKKNPPRTGGAVRFSSKSRRDRGRRGRGLLVELSHLLLGCPPAVCELGVGAVLSIDPEKWRAGRENVETGGKRTGSGKDSTGRGWGWGQRDDGEGKKERSEEAPSSCIRLVYISMSRDALCGQSVGSHFCQWSQ